MNDAAFVPYGDTVLLVANSTAPSGIQAPRSTANDPRSNGTYRIQNTASEAVYLSYAVDASTAQSNAVIPTAGNSQKVVPISAGSTEILRFSDGTFFSGIKSTLGAGNVFITPGKGV